MPELRVDLPAVATNTQAVTRLLQRHGLQLVAVTKGCRGEPRVAKAMLAGGAIALADTRDGNLLRLRAELPGIELHRLHLPSVVGRFVAGDVTYVSSLEGARAVAALGEAAEPGTRRRVMVVMESGDLREGVPREGVLGLTASIVDDPRLELVGLATNYACFRGKPEGVRESVAIVAEAARELRARGILVGRVSGGNSSLLGLLAAGEDLPSEITELRCGEALLLGQDALEHRPLPGCCGPACLLRAEVLESYTKRTSAGKRRYALLGIGRQDLGAGAVSFLEPELHEVGRSSDYLVVQIQEGGPKIAVGTTVEMIPSYEALVAAWTSPYVDLKLVGS